MSIYHGTGRDRHVAWLGIEVRRKHWGKGVGAGLMNEAIRIAREFGCRKLFVGVFEGNIRHLVDQDLDEINKLQNCREATKFCHRIPPTTKEEAKQRYPFQHSKHNPRHVS